MVSNAKSIIPVVVAGIHYDDKLLLIKRKKGTYSTKWGLIGGKIEFGEDIRHAIEREIQEEAGIKVKWIGIKGVFNERLKDANGNIIDHFLIFLCETVAEKLSGEEKDEGFVQWFDKEELEVMQSEIIPSDWFMITKLLNSKKSSADVFEVIMQQKSSSSLIIEKLENY
ncbi:MAG: NUDIX hydrolase [Candidatus Heimdallarchaeaceae archaeon]